MLLHFACHVHILHSTSFHTTDSTFVCRMLAETMTEKHQEIIRYNWETLVTNLTPEDPLNKLVAKNIISVQEQEELLKHQVTSHERARALLRLLLKRQDEAFGVLIEACKEYNMPHLAKLLEDAGTH